jgi:hypothetical protein
MSLDIILKELRNITLNSTQDISSLGQDPRLVPPEYKTAEKVTLFQWAQQGTFNNFCTLTTQAEVTSKILFVLTKMRRCKKQIDVSTKQHTITYLDA